MVERPHLSNSCSERETIAFLFSYNGSWEKVPAVVRDQGIFMKKGSILRVFLHQFWDNNLTFSFIIYYMMNLITDLYIYLFIYLGILSSLCHMTSFIWCWVFWLLWFGLVLYVAAVVVCWRRVCTCTCTCMQRLKMMGVFLCHSQSLKSLSIHETHHF